MPILLIVLSFLTQNQLFAQHISTRSNQVDGDIYHLGGAIGIGTATVANSALLELQSTEKGILIPRLSTAEMLAITSPANSLLIYNTTEKAFMFYDQTNLQWRIMVASTPTTGSKLLWGRAGSKNGTTFLANPNDKVGIGTESPTASLEIVPTTDNALRILTSTTGTPANIQFADQTNFNFVGFTAPENLSENIMFELPATRGDSGQVLTTDGQGKLVWDDKGGPFVDDIWYRNDNFVYTAKNDYKVGIGLQYSDKPLHIFRNVPESNEHPTIRLSGFYKPGKFSFNGYHIWDIENNGRQLNLNFGYAKDAHPEMKNQFSFNAEKKVAYLGLNTLKPTSNIHIAQNDRNISDIALDADSKGIPTSLILENNAGLAKLKYIYEGKEQSILTKNYKGNLEIMNNCFIDDAGRLEAYTLASKGEKFKADENGNVTAKTFANNNFNISQEGIVTATRFIDGNFDSDNFQDFLNGQWETNNNGINYNNGNVGIGTDNPQADLDIVGNNKDVQISVKRTNQFAKAPQFSSTALQIENKSGIINFNYQKVTQNMSTLTNILSYSIGNLNLLTNTKITPSGKIITSELNIAEDKFVVTPGGKVGIGTNTPQANLHIATNSTAENTILRMQRKVAWAPKEKDDKASKTLAWDIYPSVGVLNFDYGEAPFTSFNTKAKITSSGIYSNAFRNTNNNFTIDHSTSTNTVRFYGNGTNNIQIGTTSTNPEITINKDDNNVHFAETVFAKRAKVTLTGFPDYVFYDNYNLMPLPELEKYIKTNKHLPEIPSEDEIIENGYDVGEMGALQTKKIEELTLYIIELNKKVEAQNKIIQKLQNNNSINTNP